MESLLSLSSSYSSPFLLLSSSSLSPSKLHHSTPFPFAPKKSHNLLIPPLKTLTPISSQLSPSTPLTHPDLSPSDEKFDWFSHWYPLSPICDLDKRAPHAKRVLGLDVVIWWDRNLGQWRVFDDRCPHRLAPLSEGRIDQWGRLQCVYHGWCFDGIGGCKYIPQADPDGPPVHTKACAAVYPSFEQNKILWFWPNTDPNFKDIAAKHKPPHVPELDDPSYTCQIGTRDLHYGYDVLIENLMDPAHVPYAHHGLMRIPKSSGSLDRYNYFTEGGGPIDINIETSDVSGFISKQLSGYNKFIAPCLFLSLPYMSSNGGSVSSADTKNNSSAKVNQKQRTILLVFFCIPVCPGDSRVIWAFGRNFAHWEDRIIPRWILHVRNNLVFDSDLYLLHVEGRKIAEAGPRNWLKACFVPTKSDANVIAFRTWFKKYSNDQVDWGNKFDGLLLPPTPPREQLMDRYWTHVVNCSSCSVAVKCLKALEVCLQVISIASIGILAATKESLISSVKRSAIVSIALLFFLASRWLAHFIYRTFYYHDYNHAST